MAEPQCLSPTATVVPLRSKSIERALLLQTAQHAIPATALLPAGIGSLAAGAHGFELALALAEILTSAWLLRLVAIEIRGAIRDRGATHEPAAHRHGIDWAHFAAASMITVEVLSRWHTHHRWSRPLILTALVTFALAFFHGKLTRLRESRMSLRFDGESIAWRPRRTRRPFAARFDELERFEIGATRAFFGTADGRHGELDLQDLRNREEVRAALDAAREVWLGTVSAREAAASGPANPADQPGQQAETPGS